MIPANELRIGNWVYPNEENRTPWQIAVVGRTWVRFGEGSFPDERPVETDEIQLIPLTPKILEKCWFTFYKNLAEWANVTEDYSYYFIELPSGNKLEVYLDNSCNMLDAENSELKSLHQLQNLYFSIAGKELEINFK